MEDFFELSARVISRLSAFAFHADQRELQVAVAACACQCLLMAHREALAATCHFLSTLLSEGSDATLARTKRGRPLAQQHSIAIRELLLDKQLASQIVQSIAYDVAVHLPQQTVHVLSDTLLLLYYCVPEHFTALLSHAFQPYTVPPQPPYDQSTVSLVRAPLNVAAIEGFTLQLSQLAESAINIPAHKVKAVGRVAKGLLDGFSHSCRQQLGG